MFFITLAEKGGEARDLLFEKEEVTIGRLAGNDIVLNKGNVSKYHSKIVLKDGKYIVVDLKSTNGTFVNGKKIAGPLVVRPADKIYVGDYIINVDVPPEDYEGESSQGFDDSQQEDEEAPAEEEQEEEEYEEEQEEEEAQASEEEAPGEPPSRMPASLANALRRRGKHVDPRIEAYATLQKDIHDRLIEYLDLRRLDMDRLGDEELWRRTEKAIQDILAQMDGDGEIPDEIDRAASTSRARWSTRASKTARGSTPSFPPWPSRAPASPSASSSGTSCRSLI